MLLWAWFFLGLMVTQIIFLNTLIAIISDTFDRVWCLKSLIATRAKADLLCEWLSLHRR